MIEIFDSFAEVPLDVPLGDGDDTLVPGDYGIHHEPAPPRMMASAADTQRMVVPYTYLKPGSTGKPVVAAARALWRAGYLYKAPGIPFTAFYGAAKQDAMRRFKRDHGLPPNAIYDKATHALLAQYYDANALALLHAVKVVHPLDKIRAAKLGAGNFLYNHRIRLAYTQRRPWSVTRVPNLPLPGLDCSAGEAWCDLNAGAGEPSGYPGWGYGNTDSQLTHFRRTGRAHSVTTVTIRSAQIGDPIYYQGHVAWVIEPGPEPRVWSFGHYPIGIYPFDYRGDAVAVCDLLPPERG